MTVHFDVALQAAHLVAYLALGVDELVIHVTHTDENQHIDIAIPESVPRVVRAAAIKDTAERLGKLPIWHGNRDRFLKGDLSFGGMFDDVRYRVSCPLDATPTRVREVAPSEVAL